MNQTKRTPEFLTTGMTEEEQKELAEYVIKKIVSGDVFFIAEEELIDFFEKDSLTKFERTGKEVKLRGFEGLHKLFFIKNDDHFKEQAASIVFGAGANFETLLGIIFQNGIPLHCHVYHIGSRFDLDKFSEMVYSLFTETGKDHIKETRRTLLVEYGKKK